MGKLRAIGVFFGIWFLIISALVATTAFLPTGSVFSGVFALVGSLASPIVAFFLTRRRARKKKEQDVAQQAALASESKAKKAETLRRRFLERQRLLDAVDRHSTALRRNIDRAIKTNDYGAVLRDETSEAIEEFCSSIDLDIEVIPLSEAQVLIFEQLDFKKSMESEDGFNPEAIPFDGHEFERWVSESLEAFGWDATVTQGSGDQGVDVLAEKNGIKVAIQCKLYSSAVGNKAVQEAHSGKAYYGSDYAAVLSNADFTSSAKDLASVTGVMLLNHRDIPRLDEIVRQ
ncbi:restriction endonuclease [Ruegeria arenilitoris]|uniref:restriction endonuclease n=1 Tax=Ruegeria arenilitoris TaxID=1173585 RepID=UPI00147CC032|nr:restriction endonuclease [Ruegeria arenilitoris]